MEIKITPERAMELQGLAIAAQTQEKALAEKLQNFYFTNPELRKAFNSWSGYSSKMGATTEIRIIKGYYEYITHIGTSNFLIDAILNDTTDKLQQDNQKVVSRIIRDKGIQEVLKEFKKNKNLQKQTNDDAYGSYAIGNKIEAATYAQIIKNLMQRGLGKGIKIHDTSPHEFHDSILFDIAMSIDDFPFNMEVKAGINNDYLRSHFDFGTFSSTALGGGIDKYGNHLHDDTYKSLLPIIGIIAEELVDAIIKGNVTEQVMSNFAVNSAIAYIKWRLSEGHFPIFVNKKQINTCSEIIDGLLRGKGIVDTNLKVNLNNTNNIITHYSTNPYIDFMDGEIRNIQKQALQQTIKDKKTTPKFKTTVWYGKKSG